MRFPSLWISWSLQWALLRRGLWPGVEPLELLSIPQHSVLWLIFTAILLRHKYLATRLRLTQQWTLLKSDLCIGQIWHVLWLLIFRRPCHWHHLRVKRRTMVSLAVLSGHLKSLTNKCHGPISSDFGFLSLICQDPWCGIERAEGAELKCPINVGSLSCYHYRHTT